MKLRELMSYAFWLGPVALQVAICVVMMKRKLRRDYPFFFTYTLFQIISMLALLGIFWLVPHNRASSVYFYAYWTSAAMSAFLGFAVIYEVFEGAFRPYYALRDLAMVLFRWASLVMLIVAAVVAFTSPGIEADAVIAGILSLERGIRVMQCGLLLFLLLFSTRLGLSWGSHLFGMAMGFGIFASVDLSLMTVRSYLGPGWTRNLNLLHSGTYLACVAIWTGYMLKAEPARRYVDASFARPLLDRWNQVLSGVANPAPKDGFMPSIEHVVDQVMSHQVSSQVH